MKYPQASDGTYPIGTLSVEKGDIAILTPSSDVRRDGMQLAKKLSVKSGDWECLVASDWSAREMTFISGGERQSQLIMKHPSYNGELFLEVIGSHRFSSGCIIVDSLFGDPNSSVITRYFSWCRGYGNDLINIAPDMLMMYLNENFNTIRVARNGASEIVAIKLHRSENWVRI